METPTPLQFPKGAANTVIICRAGFIMYEGLYSETWAYFFSYSLATFFPQFSFWFSTLHAQGGWQQSLDLNDWGHPIEKKSSYNSDDNSGKRGWSGLLDLYRMIQKTCVNSLVTSLFLETDYVEYCFISFCYGWLYFLGRHHF